MRRISSLISRFILPVLFLLSSVLSNAQVEMADDFRGEGKIYVVLAIILVILAGFFYLLFRLDKKTKRLEEEVKPRHEEN
ncbi:MAG: CcmD family protein [Cyclobacteriaceae bacterium]